MLFSNAQGQAIAHTANNGCEGCNCQCLAYAVFLLQNLSHFQRSQRDDEWVETSLVVSEWFCSDAPFSSELPFIVLSSSESPAGTFSQDNSSSFAAFAVNSSLGANFNLSFFIRTLRPSGLVTQISNQSEVFLTVYLKDGQLQMDAPSAAPIGPTGQLADGTRHFVVLSFQNGLVYTSLLGREEELGPLVVTPLPPGFVVHVGGLPDQDSAATWGGPFKGCLQDLRLNDWQMQFVPHLAANHSGPQERLVGQTTNVGFGCTSDDTCKVRRMPEVVCLC